MKNKNWKIKIKDGRFKIVDGNNHAVATIMQTSRAATTYEKRLAHATLIAAAPDLAEKLETTTKMLQLLLNKLEYGENPFAVGYAETVIGGNLDLINALKGAADESDS